MKTHPFRSLLAGAAFGAITLTPLAFVHAQTTVTTTEAAPVIINDTSFK